MNIEPDIEVFSLNVKFEVGQLEHKLHFEVAEGGELYVSEHRKLRLSSVGNGEDIIFAFSDVWVHWVLETSRYVSLVDSIFYRLLAW